MHPVRVQTVRDRPARQRILVGLEQELDTQETAFPVRRDRIIHPERYVIDAGLPAGLGLVQLHPHRVLLVTVEQEHAPAVLERPFRIQPELAVELDRRPDVLYDEVQVLKTQ